MLAATTWRVFPTSKCLSTEGGSRNHLGHQHGWRTLLTEGVLSGENIAVTITEAGTGYNGSTAGTVTGVDLINQAYWWAVWRFCPRHCWCWWCNHQADTSLAVVELQKLAMLST